MKKKVRDIDKIFSQRCDISMHLDVQKIMRPEQELKKLRELSSLIGNNRNVGLSLNDLRRMRSAR